MSVVAYDSRNPDYYRRFGGVLYAAAWTFHGAGVYAFSQDGRSMPPLLGLYSSRAITAMTWRALKRARRSQLKK
jgi:hypothetical protein